MDDTLNRIRAVLTTTPTRWTALAATLPAELLTQPPAPKEWSALACLQHLVDTERGVFPARIRALMAGQDFARFDPDSRGTALPPEAQVIPADLAAEFARLRQEGLSLLAEITPADLSRTARHQELGPVTLGELVHEWAAHDLMHTVQAERALMQPFIRACGPWLPYFAGHVVQAGG